MWCLHTIKACVSILDTPVLVQLPANGLRKVVGDGQGVYVPASHRRNTYEVVGCLR